MKKKHPLQENYERFFGRLTESTYILKRRTTRTSNNELQDALTSIGIDDVEFERVAGGYVFESDLYVNELNEQLIESGLEKSDFSLENY